jgi:hypothetical protein
LFIKVLLLATGANLSCFNLWFVKVEAAPNGIKKCTNLYWKFICNNRIIVEKDFYLVKSVSIFTTVLQRGDGRIVHYPNSVLSKKAIDNVRQSGGMAEEMELKFALNTSFATISALEDRMKQWLSQQSRDFVTTSFSFTVKDVQVAQKTLVVAANLQHRSNWQDMAARAKRRNAFLKELREIILELEIKGPELQFPAYVPAA